jgi:hypothetical protein
LIAGSTTFLAGWKDLTTKAEVEEIVQDDLGLVIYRLGQLEDKVDSVLLEVRK